MLACRCNRRSEVLQKTSDAANWAKLTLLWSTQAVGKLNAYSPVSRSHSEGKDVAACSPCGVQQVAWHLAHLSSPAVRCSGAFKWRGRGHASQTGMFNDVLCARS